MTGPVTPAEGTVNNAHPGEAVILAKNAAQQRAAAHIISCAGLAPRDLEAAGDIPLSEATRLLLLPSSRLGDLIEQVPSDVAVICWPDTDPATTMANLCALEGTRGVLQLDDAGLIKPWELLAIARRCQTPQFPSPSRLLNWGHSWAETVLSGSDDRMRIIQMLQDFCAIWLNRRMGLTTTEVADELIMNAIYDAPVDASGVQRYADDRKAPVELQTDERPIFGFGSDGTRIVMSISDPFGRLNPGHVFCGIHRGITSGQMDTRGGGAGLGMFVIHRGAEAVFFDVARGSRTLVTAVINLQTNAKSRGSSGSVHYFQV